MLPPTGSANPYANGPNAFTLNAGDPFDAWDASTTLQIMPSEYITWVLELVHRHANAPYFASRGGVTSASGYSPSSATSNGDLNYKPDLQKDETRIDLAMLVRF